MRQKGEFIQVLCSRHSVYETVCSEHKRKACEMHEMVDYIECKICLEVLEIYKDFDFSGTLSKDSMSDTWY